MIFNILYFINYKIINLIKIKYICFLLKKKNQTVQVITKIIVQILK